MNAPSSHATPLLIEHQADDVILLKLNRPEARNAVSFEMWEIFADSLTQIERGTPPRAVVVCGAGDFFSAGGDVKTPPARGSGALSPVARLELGQKVIARLLALSAPVVAAVEGGAFGIGLSLALACDMVFAAKNARFGVPFLKFALVPDGGAAWFLTQRIGRQRAAELVYSGRAFDAEEAQGLGLVSRIVAPGQAVAEALAFAAQIGHGNRHAVELTKRLLHAAEQGDLAACHALELAYGASCQTGEEMMRLRAAAKDSKGPS